MINLNKLKKTEGGAKAPFSSPVQTPSVKMTDLNKLKKVAKQSIEDEYTRILKLPITQPLTPDQVEMVSMHYLSDKSFSSGDRLHPEQAQAMVHWAKYRGIFCTLGVGEGKTLISFMVANDMFKEVIKARQQGDLTREPRILLVVQANLMDKFEHDVKFMRKFLKEIPPSYLIRGPKEHRSRIARCKKRGLYVCSYHFLSATDAVDALKTINPSLIICDEAHNVSGTRNSARAGRFRSFVDASGTKVVPLSGTMTNKSIMDYYYLAQKSLGDNSFLPKNEKMTEEWAKLLDSSASNMGSFRQDLAPRAGPITLFPKWCAKYFPKLELPPNLVGVRRAYAQRATTAPGYIRSSDKQKVDANLMFSNNECEGKESTTGWQELEELLEVLVEDNTTPSGMVLTSAMNVWGYRYQMEAAGFYYDLYWPTPEVLMERVGTSMTGAKDILERSQDSWELKKNYNSHLLKWLGEYSREHLDTPSLVGSDMFHNKDKNVGKGLYDAWKRWKESLGDDVILRDSRPVRVCDFKIRQMVIDVKASPKEGGIIWFIHNEVGQWAMEALRSAGMDPIYCPRGDDSNKLLADTHPLKGKWVVASIPSHCTGKELQFGFHRNYLLQLPMAANHMEQLIGRTHRKGQYADEVQCRFYLATQFDHALYNALLRDTAYMKQSTTQKYKILDGTYDFRPRSIPYTALVEMGTKMHGHMTKAQEEKLLGGILG